MISVICHARVRHLGFWVINLHRQLDLPFAPSVGYELSHGDWEMVVDRAWWDDDAKVLHLFADNVFINVEVTSAHTTGSIRQYVANGWRVSSGSRVKFDSLIVEPNEVSDT